MDQNNKDNKKIDLSNTLKDSIQSSDFQQRQGQYYPFQPKMVQWTIRYSGGLIKTPKQADYVLLGFVVVAIVISLFLIFGGSGTQELHTQPESEEYIPIYP